ncbi:hypothetical protein LLY41_02985 [Cytobacillus firmus]|uniref:hypothetical protein n=1 Tax=Cytobacillus firmus TaxID=1399 RepID=UPI002186B82E|nr:hypothetical protein [Cytobacillus firmus]URM33457.1 hypothetical protein LLY41_02985 [Cytobacillus firmus]
MILTMLDKSFSFENNKDGVHELVEVINNVLTDENFFFSHLVIDGHEVYEDHEEYLLDNIANINIVEVIAMTIKEFIGSILVSLNTYTNRAIPEIEELINQFYQTPSEQSWLTLTELLDGIDWIYQTIKSIDSADHQIIGWDEFIKSAAVFEAELPNLLDAMENKDSILLADIIQYEFLPQFENIYGETEKNFERKY